MTMYLPPQFASLPQALPIEGAVTIDVQDGMPVLRAAETVQTRVEALLGKQQSGRLSEAEEHELDNYEEINDYLSFLNRTVRNIYLTQSRRTA